MPRRSQQSKSGDKRAAEARSKKAIPIDETTAEAITEQKQLFQVKFGREPGADDPLFFNPETAVPEFLGGEALEEIWRSLVQVAGESGLDPALVYAMNKTGRIVTEHNMQFLTDADLQEWNDAIDEYHHMNRSDNTQ
jgi:hypothetical protein